MPRKKKKKTLLLNISGYGTYSNHMYFSGLNFGLFRKSMKINWNLFLTDQLTNLQTYKLKAGSYGIPGTATGRRQEFSLIQIHDTVCGRTGRVRATLKKETLQHSAL
jgi:hypothetical protein